MPKTDPPFAQIVWGQFQRDAVAAKNADAKAAHPARGVGGELMPVFQRDAKARVGQHLINNTLHFNQFFLGQSSFLFGSGCLRSGVASRLFEATTPLHGSKSRFSADEKATTEEWTKRKSRFRNGKGPHEMTQGPVFT